MPNIPFQASLPIVCNLFPYHHLLFLFKLLCDTYSVYGGHYTAQ